MAGIGSYSLKWHGHASHLNSTICGLHRSDAFTDVILATSDGQFVGAHQFVLSSCSNYFYKTFIFLNQVPKTGKTVVVLPSEINYMSLNILLEYIYRGESIITDEQLPAIMKAAKLLQVRGLYSDNEVLLRPKTAVQKQNKDSSRRLDKIKPNQRVLIPEVMYSDPSKDPPQMSNENFKRSNGSMNRPSSSASSGSPVIKKQKTSSGNALLRQKKSTLKANDPEKVVIAEEVIIKDEPPEWDEENSNDPNTIVKQELEEEVEVDEDTYYVPLTCDLCQETFSTPALWVRHIDKKHPSTALAGVKKPNTDDGMETEGQGHYSPLTCEICHKVFTQPVEWVRHVQSHTQRDIDHLTSRLTDLPSTSTSGLHFENTNKVDKSQHDSTMKKENSSREKNNSHQKKPVTQKTNSM